MTATIWNVGVTLRWGTISQWDQFVGLAEWKLTWAYIRQQPRFENLPNHVALDTDSTSDLLRRMSRIKSLGEATCRCVQSGSVWLPQCNCLHLQTGNWVCAGRYLMPLQSINQRKSSALAQWIAGYWHRWLTRHSPRVLVVIVRLDNSLSVARIVFLS